MEESFREDGDASWKRVLADHLPEILEFGFPDIHQQIDWSAGYECLNTELISADKKDPARRYHVDCLFRVHIRRFGRQHTLLLHIEVQGRKETGFPYRVYRYHVRLTDQNEEEVLSLAILTDPSPSWKPAQWRSASLGNPQVFQFPVLKVIDHTEESLLQDSRPAALLLLAWHKVLQTRRGKNRFKMRATHKKQLMQRLFEGPYNEEQALRLFHSLDWLLALPDSYELQFHRDLHSLFENQITHTMKICTIESIVRNEGIEIGMERGMEQGLHRGRQVGQITLLQQLLTQRFGLLPEWARQQLEDASAEQLSRVANRVLVATTLEEVFG